MAKFCSNCGAAINEEAAFCDACGAPQGVQQAQTQYQQPQYQQPQYQYQQPQYQQPYGQPMYGAPVMGPRPGKGFGIASLILGIIGLLDSLSLLIWTIDAVDSVGYNYYYGYYYGSSDVESAFICSIIFLILPILATSFGGAARSKGFKTGVSTSGLVMGILGGVFTLVSMVICLTEM